jgi:hypothetical protein
LAALFSAAVSVAVVGFDVELHFISFPDGGHASLQVAQDSLVAEARSRLPVAQGSSVCAWSQGIQIDSFRRCLTSFISPFRLPLATMTEPFPVPLSAEDEKMKKATSTSSDTPSPIANDVYIDPRIEKRVIRKCDMRVVPPTLILFMLSFLDRVNIGNAAIQGLPQDLALVGHQFNVALLILFVPFVLLEIPSNLVMKRINPSTWLSVLLFGCGTMNSAQQSQFRC